MVQIYAVGKIDVTMKRTSQCGCKQDEIVAARRDIRVFRALRADGEESTTIPGRANATFVQQIRARLSTGAGRGRGLIPPQGGRSTSGQKDLRTKGRAPFAEGTKCRAAKRRASDRRGSGAWRGAPRHAHGRREGRHSLALSPGISAASILVKPKHFLPRSFSDAPIR